MHVGVHACMRVRVHVCMDVHVCVRARVFGLIHSKPLALNHLIGTRERLTCIAISLSGLL